jgi:hypothetical protein
MKSMISKLKDILIKWCLKFLKRNGYNTALNDEYAVIHRKEYGYLKSKANSTSDTDEGLDGDEIIARAKEIIKKIESQDFTNDLITTSLNPELQTEGVLHMRKLMELIESKTFKVGALEDVQRQRMIEDLKDKSVSLPEEIESMHSDYIDSLMKEKKEIELDKTTTGEEREEYMENNFSGPALGKIPPEIEAKLKEQFKLKKQANQEEKDLDV